VRKSFTEGTHRTIEPTATVDRVLRLAPVMGITRVANITKLDSVGLPVIMVCRPNSRSLAVSQGKGLDLEAAKASGLMESVESYHAERIVHPLKLASYEELRYTHTVVDVDSLPRLSISLFHPNLRLLWIEGYDVLQKESIWVPYELVHTDYTLPLPAGSGCFPLSSNGLASGNHILEAISHAICEVVERDATSLWHQTLEAVQAKTRVDLDTVENPACKLVLQRYDEADIQVAVWETTTDVGIASFLCTIIDADDNPFRPLYPTSGMGCHPSRDIALLRALTEAAQSRLTFIAGSRDDAIRGKYERSLERNAKRRIRDVVISEPSNRRFCDAPNYESESFDEDVAWELDRVAAASVDRVVVVNLTKPEFGLPVVRVLIPGLEGTDHAPGYVPGVRGRAILDGRS
jgi:ribosomal protein S12 methylthiotransferase accessory factor